MGKRINGFMKRKVPVHIAVLVIGLFLMAGTLVAWTGSGTVDFIAKGIKARTIAPLHSGGTGNYWLTIGETTAKTGVTILGQFKFSGATLYGLRQGSTNLSGVTAIGYTITGPDQGNIFYIGNTAQVNGGGQVNSSTVGNGAGVLDGRSGITVVIPRTITEAMNDWEFTVINHRSGTSEIVLLAATTGAAEISGVTFIGMSSPTSLVSGVTPGAAISGVTINSYGESLTLVAKYQATADMSGNTSHYLIKDYKVAIN